MTSNGALLHEIADKPGKEKFSSLMEEKIGSQNSNLQPKHILSSLVLPPDDYK